MQALPEVTPRKEPTEITGSLFAVAVVIPLNYPRVFQYARACTLIDGLLQVIYILYANYPIIHSK